ncbi:MAG: WG repeat-containing protein [Saprospiraceae bacterium]|nr:WG repeat-containing protein [Saprospiraceae bacterium]
MSNTSYKIAYVIAFCLTFPLIISCQKSAKNDALYMYEDPSGASCGYKNAKGQVVIPAGKYAACFTDTLYHYAFVFESEVGMIAIDKRGARLYEVFIYDNGPDPASEGLFRFMHGGKIGYADAQTGKIIIGPLYDGAFPFENGMAKVGINCTTTYENEHATWTGGLWKYIDRDGRTVTPLADENNKN